MAGPAWQPVDLVTPAGQEPGRKQLPQVGDSVSHLTTVCAPDREEIGAGGECPAGLE